MTRKHLPRSSIYIYIYNYVDLASSRSERVNSDIVAIITTFMESAFINATIITESMLDSRKA